MLDSGSLPTVGSSLCLSLACLHLLSVVPATTHLRLLPALCRALSSNAHENNDASGSGMEGTMSPTVCALHSSAPLSPGTLSKYISALRGGRAFH